MKTKLNNTPATNMWLAYSGELTIRRRKGLPNSCCSVLQLFCDLRFSYFRVSRLYCYSSSDNKRGCCPCGKNRSYCMGIRMRVKLGYIFSERTSSQIRYTGCLLCMLLLNKKILAGNCRSGSDAVMLGYFSICAVLKYVLNNFPRKIA